MVFLFLVECCFVDVVALFSLPPVIAPKWRSGAKNLVQSTLKIKFGVWGGGSAKKSFWALKANQGVTKTERIGVYVTRSRANSARTTDYEDRVQIVRKKQCKLLLFRRTSCTR